jgi:hypothetical protein
MLSIYIYYKPDADAEFDVFDSYDDAVKQWNNVCGRGHINGCYTLKKFSSHAIAYEVLKNAGEDYLAGLVLASMRNRVLLSYTVQQIIEEGEKVL